MDSVFSGCGYVGRQVARRERELSGNVFAVVRSPSSAEQLIREGIQSIALDLEEISVLGFSLSDKVLYWFAPPQPEGMQDRRLRRCLELAAQIGQIPKRIVLINTTGVYGDCQGDWVTETRPRRPQTGRATRRVDAEDFARSWCDFHAVTLVVLRVPGIYGLGKLPLDRIKNARPVLAPELCPWSNRVHVEDLITACMSAARIKAPAPAYNISDGHPSTMTDFFFRVADAAGLRRPPILTAQQASEQLSKEMQSYLAESKRIDNTLMREHLGVVPCFPDLESGLNSIFSSVANSEQGIS